MHETTHLSYEEGTVNITLNSESSFEVVAPNFRCDDYNSFVNAGFTKKELEAISGGQTADIIFDLTISEDIENEELKSWFAAGKEKQEPHVGRLSDGMYIQMSATKAIGDAPYETISTLSEDTLIEMEIPLYLRSQDRNYYIMISNMGDCVLLPDLDNEPETITFSTHNMTTGILLYLDPLEAREKGEAEKFRLQPHHLLWAGVVLLILAWIFITHFHKKNM